MILRHAVLTCALLATLMACGRAARSSHVQHDAPAATAPAAAGDAVCVLQATAGNQVTGTVRFHEQGGVLVITATVSGLRPGGKHAFHIHQFGDLRAADGASAGDHYNPAGHDHGGPGAQQHHAGDLGNLAADGAGAAHYELRVGDLTISEILGRSVVVHANEDDLASQPAGNAGPRIAVGVIGLAQPVE